MFKKISVQTKTRVIQGLSAFITIIKTLQDFLKIMLYVTTIYSVNKNQKLFFTFHLLISNDCGHKKIKNFINEEKTIKL